jgi:hypothetical protein
MQSAHPHASATVVSFSLLRYVHPTHRSPARTLGDALEPQHSLSNIAAACTCHRLWPTQRKLLNTLPHHPTTQELMDNLPCLLHPRKETAAARSGLHPVNMLMAVCHSWMHESLVYIVTLHQATASGSDSHCSGIMPCVCFLPEGR